MAYELKLWTCDLRPYGYSSGETARIQSLAAVVEDVAKKIGVPPLVILATIWVESRGVYDAQSPVGAQGLMQVMPSTGKSIAQSLRIAWTPNIPAVNVLVGTVYLRRLMDAVSQEIAEPPAWYAPLRALLGRDPTVIDGAWVGYRAGLGNLRRLDPNTELGKKIGRYVEACNATAKRFAATERACQGRGDVYVRTTTAPKTTITTRTVSGSGMAIVVGALLLLAMVK